MNLPCHQYPDITKNKPIAPLNSQKYTDEEEKRLSKLLFGTNGFSEKIDRNEPRTETSISFVIDRIGDKKKNTLSNSLSHQRDQTKIIRFNCS